MAKPRMQKKGPRIGLIDIETSPILANVWGLFKQNIGLEMIDRDWNILSVCFKWLGERKVTYADVAHKEDYSDDKELLELIWQFLDDADVIVAQNGRRFDVKKINARFIEHGMVPPSPYKIVDTLEVAKRHFGFTSNKLAWMTDKLCTVKKRSHAKFPGYKLWQQCLRGNREAWREMRLYNIDDVRSMEELYLIFLPWISNHPNFGNYVNLDKPVCNRCGSEHIVKNGTYHTDVGQYQRFRCHGCGGTLRGRILMNSKEHRKNLLMGTA